MRQRANRGHARAGVLSLLSQALLIARKYSAPMFLPFPGYAFSDSAGTTPAVQDGPVGRVNDYAGSSVYASQSTSGYRPILRKGTKNLYINSASLSTQNNTVAATSYTVQFTGSGTITFSGAYSGSLAGGGTKTFACTAGTLTSTVTDTVNNAQLEVGSTASAYVATTSAPLSNGIGPWWLDGDGAQTRLNVSSVLFNPQDSFFASFACRRVSLSGRGGMYGAGDATHRYIEFREETNGTRSMSLYDSSGTFHGINTTTGPDVGVDEVTHFRKAGTAESLQVYGGTPSTASATDSTSYGALTGSVAYWMSSCSTSGTATYLFNGAMYGACFGNGSISSAELKTLDRYLASVTNGVTIT